MKTLPLALLAIVAGVADPGRSAADPVVVPRSQLHDFTSRIDGRAYRVEVATPFHADPLRSYPVMYILDGNWYFLPVAANITESGKTITPAIVVGVGYPTFDNDAVARRRMHELAGSEILRVLVEEIRPWVNEHYHVDPSRQILFGKSMGGLAVLRMFFQHPDAFQTWVAASPAINFDHSALLHEPRAAAHAERMLITVGGLEDHPTMIDPAVAMARDLGATFEVIPDENHVSVSLACLGRAINFALPPPPEPAGEHK